MVGVRVSPVKVSGASTSGEPSQHRMPVRLPSCLLGIVVDAEPLVTTYLKAGGQNRRAGHDEHHRRLAEPWLPWPPAPSPIVETGSRVSNRRTGSESGGRSPKGAVRVLWSSNVLAITPRDVRYRGEAANVDREIPERLRDDLCRWGAAHRVSALVRRRRGHQIRSPVAHLVRHPPRHSWLERTSLWPTKNPAHKLHRCSQQDGLNRSFSCHGYAAGQSQSWPRGHRS